MSMWQGHVGSLHKIWNLGDKPSYKVIFRKVRLLLDAGHLRQSLKGLEEPALGCISRTMTQNHRAEPVCSGIPCGPRGCRSQRNVASAPASAGMRVCQQLPRVITLESKISKELSPFPTYTRWKM